MLLWLQKNCSYDERIDHHLHLLLEHQVQSLFLAIADHSNLRIYGGDAYDAFKYSLVQSVTNFLSIDDQFYDGIYFVWKGY